MSKKQNEKKKKTPEDMGLKALEGELKVLEKMKPGKLGSYGSPEPERYKPQLDYAATLIYGANNWCIISDHFGTPYGVYLVEDFGYFRLKVIKL